MNKVWVVEIFTGHVTAGEEAQGPPGRRDGEDLKAPWTWGLVIYLFQL